jgi:hypothetical protein
MVLQHAAAPAPQAAPLRVHRLKEGQSGVYRIFEPHLLGCFTHYIKDRSQYCHGPSECRYQHDKLDRVWKGYASADFWDPTAKVWQPVVAEITECCEVDMRGLYLPGQQWQFVKQVQVGKQRPKLNAILVANVTPGVQVLPYNIVPALQTMFHVEEVRLIHPNPCPARVMVVPFQGPPPGQVTPTIPDDPEVLRKAQEGIRRRAKGLFGMPDDQDDKGAGNGKGGGK